MTNWVIRTFTGITPKRASRRTEPPTAQIADWSRLDSLALRPWRAPTRIMGVCTPGGGGGGEDEGVGPKYSMVEIVSWSCNYGVVSDGADGLILIADVVGGDPVNPQAPRVMWYDAAGNMTYDLVVTSNIPGSYYRSGYTVTNPFNHGGNLYFIAYRVTEAIWIPVLIKIDKVNKTFSEVIAFTGCYLSGVTHYGADRRYLVVGFWEPWGTLVDPDSDVTWFDTYDTGMVKVYDLTTLSVEAVVKTLFESNDCLGVARDESSGDFFCVQSWIDVWDGSKFPGFNVFRTKGSGSPLGSLVAKIDLSQILADVNYDVNNIWMTRMDNLGGRLIVSGRYRLVSYEMYAFYAEVDPLTNTLKNYVDTVGHNLEWDVPAYSPLRNAVYFVGFDDATDRWIVYEWILGTNTTARTWIMPPEFLWGEGAFNTTVVGDTLRVNMYLGNYSGGDNYTSYYIEL